MLNRYFTQFTNPPDCFRSSHINCHLIVDREREPIKGLYKSNFGTVIAIAANKHFAEKIVYALNYPKEENVNEQS